MSIFVQAEAMDKTQHKRGKRGGYLKKGKGNFSGAVIGNQRQLKMLQHAKNS